MRGRRAPAIAVHHAQRNAGCQCNDERDSEEVHYGCELCLAIILGHNNAAVNAAVMAWKLSTLVTQFTSEIFTVDRRRISAALDVHQQHRLDIASSSCKRPITKYSPFILYIIYSTITTAHTHTHVCPARVCISL